MLRVLNLYAGIGGNRKLWRDVKVTAVELDKEVAEIYSDLYPDDEVIIADAHDFLLEHFSEYNFIWSSPPCPTHSRARFWGLGNPKNKTKPVYPDMRLYQEIILLQYHKKDGYWVVENVIPYYEPLIKPTVVIDRHLFWSNKYISPMSQDLKFPENRISDLQELYGIDLSKYCIDSRKKLTLLRNAVNPVVGLYVFNEVVKNRNSRLTDWM